MAVSYRFDRFCQPRHAVHRTHACANRLKKQKTIKLHGYPFCEERIALQGADSEQLTKLLSSPRSFTRYTGNKSGGGYHPDYCIEWKTDSDLSHALVSLECGEIKIYHAGEELHCDLSNEAASALKQSLGRYQEKRPAKD